MKKQEAKFIYDIDDNHMQTLKYLKLLNDGDKIPVDVGIDIQPNAVGIAFLPVDDDYKNSSFLIPPVVRVYGEGVAYKKDGISEVSRAEERRVYRGKRRGIARKKGRRKKLMYHLEYDGFPYEKCDDIYRVRTTGLDKKLSKGEIAAVLLYLTKHRGYLSNRKCGEDKDGKVKKAISELESDIKASNSRTLGEYFYKSNSSGIKVRDRYIAREMTVNEYNFILNKQQEFYPEIKDLRDKWFRIVYHQRPLKSCKELRGQCSIFPKEVRAPKLHYKSQEFILRAFLNNLTIKSPEGDRKLTQDENDMLYEHLEYREKMTIKEVRKKLELSNSDILSVEEQKSENIKGHHTNYILKKNMGDIWVEATDEVIEADVLKENEKGEK